MDTRVAVQRRFVDPDAWLYGLAEHSIHVACPTCGNRAEVVLWLDREPPQDQDSAWWPRRLVCRACGHVKTWPMEGTTVSTSWGTAFDPYFRQPLWLQAECCGGRTFWAFNERHLDIIEGYVGAWLRERGKYRGMTMLAKLPAWLKAAKHRNDILRTINRLRGSLHR